jgi:hypothetical protein
MSRNQTYSGQLFDQDKPVRVSLLFVVLEHIDRKAMLPRCLENVYPASFHGRPCPVRMETGAADIAFCTAIAGAASKGPGLIETIEKNSAFEIDEEIVKLIDRRIIFFPVQVNKDPVCVGVKDFPHFFRRWCVGWTAVGPSISGAAELALHAYPWSCEYLGGLYDNCMAYVLFQCMFTISLKRFHRAPLY